MSAQDPVCRYPLQIVQPGLSDVRKAPVYLRSLAIFPLGVCIFDGSRFGSGHVYDEVLRLIAELFTQPYEPLLHRLAEDAV